MPDTKNYHLIRSVRSRLKVDPALYADTTFQALSEKIADDYAAIIKNCVVPSLGDAKGLKIRELRILVCLEFYDVPLSPAHIAAMLRYDPATVTRAVKCLERAEMVRREKDRHDTRSILLHLTESGLKLAETYARRAKATFDALEKTIKNSLTQEEKMQYLNMMYKISKRTEVMRELSANLPELRNNQDEEAGKNNVTSFENASRLMRTR